MLFETILGGITGLVGNIVTSIFNYKSAKLEIDRAKQQNEFDLKMVDAETRAMIMEAKANIRVTQAQVEGAVDIKDAEAEIAAFKKINSEASLELYNQLKKNVAIATRCKAASQREYDDLKADYEGWFKSSTSAMAVDRQRVTPVWLDSYFGQMVIAYVAMHRTFGAIVIPEH